MSALGETRSVTFITGCLALFRNSFLPDIGVQDERFFLYLDDIELSARIAGKGYDLLYVPGSVIYHRVLGEGENPLKLYYSVRNRLLLIRTGFTGPERLIACFYFHCVILAKLAVWRIAHPTFFRAAWMGLQDYYRGCFQEGRGVGKFLREPGP
jgi:GT2 family glycosyltransferase